MKKTGRRILYVINTIHNYFVYFAMLLIVVMTLVIALNVFMRYVLNSGLQWGEEVAKLLVVWFTYIAMAVGVKQGLHISLQLIPASVPSWFNRFLDILKLICILAAAVVMIIFGIRLVNFTSRSIMPATKWPSSTLYFIVPFSGILILFEAVIALFKFDDAAAGVETILDRLAGDSDTQSPNRGE